MIVSRYGAFGSKSPVTGGHCEASGDWAKWCDCMYERGSPAWNNCPRCSPSPFAGCPEGKDNLLKSQLSLAAPWTLGADFLKFDPFAFAKQKIEEQLLPPPPPPPETPPATPPGTTPGRDGTPPSFFAPAKKVPTWVWFAGGAAGLGLLAFLILPPPTPRPLAGYRKRRRR